MLSDLKLAALNTKNKTQRDYYILRKFEVFDYGRTEKLIMKRKADSPILYELPLEEIYSAIKKTRIESGHGGRDKMLHCLFFLTEFPVYISVQLSNMTKQWCTVHCSGNL